MCLHCGPASIQPSAFHSQFDNGTFELMAHGEYLMRDPGVYCYARGDPQREAFRRTAAHQTLTLDEVNSTRAGRLLHWDADDGCGNAHLTVENQSYPDLAHRRTVFFVARQYFVLVDEALGVACGDVALHYQFAPGQVVVDAMNHQAYTQYGHGSNVLVWQSPDATVALEAEEAWYSPEHNTKMPMPAVRYVHEQHMLPVRFVTVIAPWRGTGLPRISTQITGQPGDDVVSVHLQVNEETFDLRRLIKR